MRIVHVVCSDRFAGVERYLTYIAPAITKCRHEVTVIGGDPVRMNAEMAGAGVQFVAAASPSDALRALLALRHRVDLVHVHMTDAEAIGVLTRPILQVPVVATLHFARPRGSSPVRRAVADIVARGLSGQIAISRFVARTAGVDDAVVVPNGVPWCEPAQRREQVVLVAQRLEGEKDGATALRAWSSSGLGPLGWRLVFAGDGSERQQLADLASDLGVSESVEFIGNTPHLGREMARASMFLASAPAEPFGLSVVEAMAAGLPVVATASGAHQETVGRAGDRFLFAYGDADAAGEALARLGRSEEARVEYGDQLRVVYEQHFTVDRHVERLLQEYARICR